ncbi:MAG: hypothetical protein ILP11_01075 [Alphaproteobacteria bacterium]|nr:hypothetical protein [Alphaproteobacteria bacterium]
MKKAFAILFVMLFLQGCATPPDAPFQPSSGILYSEYKAPLTINFDKTKVSDIRGMSHTTHVSLYYLSFAVGDASLKEAMQDGSLAKAAYADYEWMSILGIFGRLKVHVYGLEDPKKD